MVKVTGNKTKKMSLWCVFLSARKKNYYYLNYACTNKYYFCFVHTDCVNGVSTVKICEHFLGLISVVDTSGLGLTETILKHMYGFQIPVNKKGLMI